MVECRSVCAEVWNLKELLIGHRVSILCSVYWSYALNMHPHCLSVDAVRRLCDILGCAVCVQWMCVRETWGACCWVLWRLVKESLPLLPKPWLALDWWGRCCLCSLIHHTLYLGFRGKEKGKKTEWRKKDFQKYQSRGLGCGRLRSWVRGGPFALCGSPLLPPCL